MNNKRAKILVVDDIQANLIAMKALLNDINADVILVSNGNRALTLSLTHDFALILLDVQMPDMNGYEVAQFLREEEQTKKIPIMFVTAIYTSEEHHLRGYNLGAVDYILKPVKEDILLSKVDVFIQLWQQKQNLINEIDRRKQAQNEALRSSQLSKLLLNSTSEGFFGISTQGLCTFINSAAETILGYTHNELVGKKIHQLIHYKYNNGSAYKEDECPIYNTLLTKQKVTIDNEVFWHKKGHSFFVEYSTAPIINDHKIEGVVVNFRNISKRHKEKSQLQFKALHDSLTGLPNRDNLYMYLDQVISRAKRNNLPFALLFFDLDGFKDINDNYGHDAGDLVLHALGKRLQKTSRKSDFIARIGGDEFIYILESFHSIKEAAAAGKRILEITNQPVQWNKDNLQVGCSIGIACYPDDADTADELIEQADCAMYKAKQKGKNTYTFVNDDILPTPSLTVKQKS